MSTRSAGSAPSRKAARPSVTCCNPPARRIYLEKAPLLVLSAAATFLAVLARIEFGSLAEVNEVGWGARLVASVYALAFPLWKMVIPVGLSPLYDLRAALGRGPWPFVMAGRPSPGSPRWRGARPPLAGLRGGVGVLRDHAAAGSGLVQNGPQIAADRYTYLAGGGWALLAGGGLVWCAAHVTARSPRAALARGVLGLMVAATLVLVSASAWQALIWHNSVTLWSRVVELEPDGAIARTGPGTALLADGRPLEAAAHDRRALEIFPRLPEANLGLALILAGEGRGAEALLHGRQAVARQPQRAGFRMVFAEILWGADRREESLAELREGARLAPAVPLFPYLLAVKLARMGRGPGGHRRARGGPPARARRVPLGSRGRSIHGAGVRVDRSPHRRGRLAALRDRAEPGAAADGAAAQPACVWYRRARRAHEELGAAPGAPPGALRDLSVGQLATTGGSSTCSPIRRSGRHAADPAQPAGGRGATLSSGSAAQPSSSTGRTPSAAAARRALAQASPSRAAPGAARGRRRPMASA